ncbi:MAG: ArsA family ATPase [Idiomarina sp.]|nr:ArsA family ATPase [Idiomarina sp.]
MQLTDKSVVLIGGKGGVGKTTMASSLALLAARQGRRVLLVSTDPAHSLADAFDQPIGDQVTEIIPNLDVLEIDPDREVTAHIARVTQQMKSFTSLDMFAEIERQMKLTAQSPGAQEAALLERIARILDEAETTHDLVIFDTAPTGHTLRLLSLPEAMAAWTQGMLRQDSKSKRLGGVLDHLTPKQGKDIDHPLNDPLKNETTGKDARTTEITERLLERQRLFHRTRHRLTNKAKTALVFVLTPEKLPILETRRAVTTLVEEKLPLAGLIVNRILPDEADGAFLAQRRAQEKEHLQTIEKEFKGIPRLGIALLPTDIQGMAALQAMADRLQAAGVK